MRFRDVIKQVSRSSLLKNVLTLFSGKVVAQLIIIGSAPIIARLFTPADFGAAALILAIAGLITPLSTFSFGTAAQLAERDCEARRLLRIALFTTSVGVLFLTLLILGFQLFDPEGYLSQFNGWAWAIPIVFLLYGVESALESWNTRRKQFKIQATTYISSTTVSVGSRIYLGATYGSSIGSLVVGYILGLVTRVLVLAGKSDLIRPQQPSNDQPRSYRALISHYRDFPLFATPTALLHSFNRQLPLLMFGTLFSPAIAGFYAMADRLFLRPLNLIQTSFRTVYTQHLISAVKGGRPGMRTFLKACVFTGAFMLVPSVSLALFGESAVALFLGDRWRVAGTYIEITAPLMFFASIVIPANAAMVVFRKQRRLLGLQVVTTLSLVAGFTLAFWYWGTPEAALRALVIVMALRHLYTLLVAFSIVRKSDQERTQPGK
ncbi:hypothetical protein CKO25_09435 [Thiocapsa imhoffii]|uniref:Lipopolysaccharide biosynthesis protein n=1 Tax=Thiocapsa imhoffii TaxID=382777 RepID=A0A9X0WHK5_9GAMM|nr:oligosaccharide flippase family protein [Thiocapsa imhoffii]MBK1644866.1 hypothetical protein [Thiocapsa imhoffii]